MQTTMLAHCTSKHVYFIIIFAVMIKRFIVDFVVVCGHGRWGNASALLSVCVVMAALTCVH